MAKGDERDIQNDVLLKDLLRAGYIETLEPENEGSENEGSENEEPEVATSQKQPSKRGVKSNESK